MSTANYSNTTITATNVSAIDDSDLIATVFALVQTVESLSLSVQDLASIVMNGTAGGTGYNGASAINSTIGGNSSYLMEARRAKLV